MSRSQSQALWPAPAPTYWLKPTFNKAVEANDVKKIILQTEQRVGPPAEFSFKTSKTQANQKVLAPRHWHYLLYFSKKKLSYFMRPIKGHRTRKRVQFLPPLPIKSKYSLISIVKIGPTVRVCPKRGNILRMNVTVVCTNVSIFKSQPQCLFMQCCRANFPNIYTC